MNWGGVGVNMDPPQDIHIHLGSDSSGKGPDVGAGGDKGGEDYTDMMWNYPGTNYQIKYCN